LFARSPDLLADRWYAVNRERNTIVTARKLNAT
jgi:hypothetical protein